jgi:acetylglutamate kinase
VLDLGFVGEPESVDPRVLKLLIGADIVPVVAPVGVGEDGQTYNINADTVAGAIAGALGAERLLMLTDVPGVLGPEEPHPGDDDRRGQGGHRGRLDLGRHDPEGRDLHLRVERGVKGAVILDGREPHAILQRAVHRCPAA